jgi:hypothetical protein
VLYIVGAYTGYHQNEIGSVTTRSFDLGSEPPTLTVQAGYSKHRRTDVVPLRRDFADLIQSWIASKPGLSADKPLFEVSDKRSAEMIQKDLTAARAKWIDKAMDAEERERRKKSSFLASVDGHGHVVDFHSLRKAFITN